MQYKPHSFAMISPMYWMRGLGTVLRATLHSSNRAVKRDLRPLLSHAVGAVQIPHRGNHASFNVGSSSDEFGEFVDPSQTAFQAARNI